jgi:hypothetical protein
LFGPFPEPSLEKEQKQPRDENFVAISYDKELNLRFSGDEVYYTACSFLVILKNSCSELH